MSKKRVFANNNNNLNFNDYLKYKTGKEIIKNVKTKPESNKNINSFLNYEQFITLTKTYFKYFINEGLVIGIPVDIYNSNISFIVYKNLLSHIKDCNECRFSSDITNFSECQAVKGILYPYGKYIEYETSRTIFLHNRINLDDTCRPIHCKELTQELSLDKTLNTVEIYPSQNNFVIQPIQNDNYSQMKRMNAYAMYPHICAQAVKTFTADNNITDQSNNCPNCPNCSNSKNSSTQSNNNTDQTYTCPNCKNSRHSYSQSKNCPKSKNSSTQSNNKISCNGCKYTSLCKNVRSLFIN